MKQYLTHKRILVIFWTMVVLMLYSWIRVITLGNNVSGVSQIEAQFLIITSFLVFPIIILIALIPSGYFKDKTNVN